MSIARTLLQDASRSRLALRTQWLGAVLLLLGLVLPLYSCRGQATGKEVRYLDQRGGIVDGIDPLRPLPAGVTRLEPDRKPPPEVNYQKRFHYFFSDFSVDDVIDWFRLGGFLWPMAAVLFVHRLRHRWSRRLFRILEPFLVLETAFALSLSAMFGTKEIGFWIAWPGAILYSLGAAWADTIALYAWKQELGRSGKTLGAMLIFGAFLASSVLSVLVFFKWVGQ